MDTKGYIICVDDEKTVLDTLQEQLTGSFSSTHDVLTANSGEEALELLATLTKEGETVDLVITDQVMPKMKGDELLKVIQERYPDTMKILLTGQAGLDATIKAINYGGLNRFVEKPWNKEDLVNDIQALINKFRENLENQRLIARLESRINELETRT